MTSRTIRYCDFPGCGASNALGESQSIVAVRFNLSARGVVDRILASHARATGMHSSSDQTTFELDLCWSHVERALDPLGLLLKSPRAETDPGEDLYQAESAFIKALERDTLTTGDNAR